jgi:PAS domain S-box-containing protein
MRALKVYDTASLAQAMFEEAAEALFLVDPEADRLIEVNPVALRLSGFTRHDLLQSQASYLFRSEERGGRQRLRQASEKSGLFHSQEGYLLRTPEPGVWVPVSLSVARLHVTLRTIVLITARDLREQRETQAQLRKKEAELSQLMASIPDCLWSAEVGSAGGWTYHYISPMAQRITGYPAAHFLAGPERWEGIVYPPDRAAWAEARSLIRQGHPRQTEYRLTRPDGSVRWVRESVAVARRDEGALRLDAVVTDVTDRRRAEEALQANHAMLRAVLEGITDAVFVKNRAGQYLMINSAGARRLGKPPDEVVGRDDAALSWAPETARQVIEDDQRILATGQTQTFESASTAGGVTLLYLTTKAPYRDADGNVAGVIGIARDITALKEAEEACRESEDRLRQIVENVEEVLWMTDAHSTRVIYVNPAYEAIWGRTCQSLYERPHSWLDGVHPDDRERVRLAVDGAAADGSFGVEYRIVRPDGAVRWVWDRGFGVRDADGRLYRWVGFAKDVTDRKRLEDQFRQAQKMEAVGRLAGGVAHDFNNLLTVITGYCELLLPALPAGGPDHGFAAEIRQAAEKAAALTRQLLAFGRKQILTPQVLDVNGLIRDTENMLRRLIREDIDLATRLEPSVGSVRADPGQIQQVLMNLVVNARDALAHGGQVTIETANVELDQV